MKRNKSNRSKKYGKPRSMRHNSVSEGCNKLIGENPRDAHAYFIRAHQKNLQGNLKGAIWDYNIGLLINPNDIKALINRAIILNYLGEHNSAISDLTNAIVINPKMMNSYLIRGNAYKDAGNLEKAIDDFDYVIKFFPKESMAYIGRGDTKFLLNDFQGALDDYVKAVANDPSQKEVYTKMEQLKIDSASQKTVFSEPNKPVKWGFWMLMKYFLRLKGKINSVLNFILFLLIFPINELLLDNAILLEI